MMGPWGGPGGDRWSVGPATRLIGISIRHGDAINALGFEYEIGGRIHTSTQRGNDGGQQIEIRLEEGEFLTFLIGYYGEQGGYVVVKSLTLVSNRRQYGPYGKSEGTSFHLPEVGTHTHTIVGFFGRCGLADGYFDAIGVYLRPITLGGGDASALTTRTEANNGVPIIRLGFWSIPLGFRGWRGTLQFILLFMIVFPICLTQLLRYVQQTPPL